jgi:ABC-type antimicrobial peptide transport system permease subunit
MYQILAGFHMDIAVRTHLDADVAQRAIRDSVHELHPDLALQEETTMQQIVDDSLGNQTLATRLLGIFGAAAMVIAVTGIYGLLAYSVSQRTRELGLRLALGAQPRDLLWMVLRHALVLLAIGLAGGLAAAWTAHAWMRSFVYAIPAFDQGTVFLIVVLLTMFGLAASYLPARRAAGVDPMVALRTE